MEQGIPYSQVCISREAWLAKIKACVEACRGTDCIVIARTEVPDLNEAIERCIRARMLGADMTLICRSMKTLEDGEKVAEYDKGWKMWPDVFSVNGVPNVELEDVQKLGFNLVTFHVFEKAALYGMLRFGEENRKAGNNLYSELHPDGDSQLAEELERALNFNRDSWLEQESLNK